MTRRWLIALGLVAAVVVAIAASGTTHSPDAGRPAPALPTEVLVPPAVTVADLRGKPAAINFWASWCDPCRQEAPGFARLPGELRGDARLVGVDWSDNEADARAFVRKFRWRFPVLRDANGTVGDDYRITGLPTTFILSSHGRIVRVLRGPQTAAEIRAQLQRVRQ